jgi:hypothetical protein
MWEKRRTASADREEYFRSDYGWICYFGQYNHVRAFTYFARQLWESYLELILCFEHSVLQVRIYPTASSKPVSLRLFTENFLVRNTLSQLGSHKCHSHPHSSCGSHPEQTLSLVSLTRSSKSKKNWKSSRKDVAAKKIKTHDGR